MHAREQYLETSREEYRRANKKGTAGRGPSEAPRHGAEVVTALAELWELFDFACGQRLAWALRTEVPRLLVPRITGSRHRSRRLPRCGPYLET